MFETRRLRLSGRADWMLHKETYQHNSIGKKWSLEFMGTIDIEKTPVREFLGRIILNY